MPDDGLRPPRADLREPRILLDLAAPSLVLGEVPVERVDLLQRNEIDVLLHELLRHEVTTDIQVGATPCEPRMIDNAHGRNRPRHAVDPRRAENVGRQKLADGLEAIENAGAFASLD